LTTLVSKAAEGPGAGPKRAMKGIILAGGSGSRLYPATMAVNKQLLPVYDKPMIYYPMSVLMLADIHEIMIISSPGHIDNFVNLFGDGTDLGLQMSYAVQERPEGLAQAFTIGRDFVGTDGVTLVLGDNIFFGAGLAAKVGVARARDRGATIFAYHVDDPERYGVVTLDQFGRALAIEEKPRAPQSPWAVTGLYVYDNAVLGHAARLKPSARGELEITDLNRIYLAEGQLHVDTLSRGYTWLDTGTHESLLEASQFVHVMQKRQGSHIACLEEIAFRNGYIDLAHLMRRAKLLEKTSYGRYLTALAREEPQIVTSGPNAA